MRENKSSLSVSLCSNISTLYSIFVTYLFSYTFSTCIDETYLFTIYNIYIYTSLYQLEWSQDITMEIKLPTTDPYIVQRWFEANHVTFNMYDYMIGGVVPHTELVASACMNLASVLKVWQLNLFGTVFIYILLLL